MLTSLLLDAQPLGLLHELRERLIAVSLKDVDRFADGIALTGHDHAEEVVGPVLTLDVLVTER